MKVAVIGSGNVGGTLGRRLSHVGYEVSFGVREPGTPDVEALLARCATGTSALSPQEAANRAEVILLATPWGVAKEVIEGLGDLTGKVLVDCTNPIGPGLTLTHAHTTSGGEQVAQWATGARVVKSFNSTGWENMDNPDYGKDKITMFACGDDEAAKATVCKMIDALGFEPLDIGNLEMCRFLEPVVMIWIREARMHRKGPHFAFRIIRREDPAVS